MIVTALVRVDVAVPGAQRCVCWTAAAVVPSLSDVPCESGEVIRVTFVVDLDLGSCSCF